MEASQSSISVSTGQPRQRFDLFSRFAAASSWRLVQGGSLLASFKQDSHSRSGDVCTARHFVPLGSVNSPQASPAIECSTPIGFRRQGSSSRLNGKMVRRVNADVFRWDVGAPSLKSNLLPPTHMQVCERISMLQWCYHSVRSCGRDRSRMVKESRCTCCLGRERPSLHIHLGPPGPAHTNLHSRTPPRHWIPRAP